jgi:hypothetical protein
MAKDWPGRPLYMQSAIAAYFATRQWVQAVRSWVADEACWSRAQRFSQFLRDLRHDQDGSFRISLYSGHWGGQGEPLGGVRGPAGDLISLRDAVKDYFELPFVPISVLRGRTIFRGRFEGIIRRMAEPNPPGEVAPLPSSQPLQRSMRIVVLRVLQMRGISLGDPGPDDADLYARARVGGQPLSSPVIHGHDSYSFPNPNEPFTWIKAVPAVPDEGEPVESIEVEVRTGDVRFAGTDDDVFPPRAAGDQDPGLAATRRGRPPGLRRRRQRRHQPVRPPADSGGRLRPRAAARAPEHGRRQARRAPRRR